jgi:transcriptional regulator with XRE-family HTH domain
MSVEKRKMVKSNQLGKRIKKVRESKYMTLKKLEAKAGISATHISEIERGKTSPTINVLMHIADALDKDTAYFLEEKELSDVSFIALEDRETKDIEGKNGVATELTHSIPGGKITSRFITLAPDKEKKLNTHTHKGDEAVFVLKGQVTFHVEGKNYTLEEGDSIYIAENQKHDFRNVSENEEAQLIWVGSERHIT